MSSWLDPVRDTLDRREEPLRLFFRDDDAGWADDELVALLDLFEHHDVAIDVAAIPCAVTDQVADELIARHDAGVRVHQHGYAHTNHQKAGRACEFGDARGRADRELDVAGGQRSLRQRFGDLLDPVFTPPWNRCTPDLAPALLASGIGVLSRDRTATPLAHPGLHEVPVTIDWFGRSKVAGTLPVERRRWSRAELGERLAAAAAAPDPMGVMLHHAVTDAHEREAIGQLLQLVSAHPGVTCTTIAALVPC